jgi:nucleotide-binding universal stress UspA family protein
MNKRIVVGIDGSDSAADALRWAIEQAKVTGATVEAVYAWDPGALVSLAVPPMIDWEPLREAAKARPVEIVREAVGNQPGVRIVTKTMTGNPAQVLVDRSAHADRLARARRAEGDAPRLGRPSLRSAFPLPGRDRPRLTATGDAPPEARDAARAHGRLILRETTQACGALARIAAARPPGKLGT